jgi:hypothetical protein
LPKNDALGVAKGKEEGMLFKLKVVAGVVLALGALAAVAGAAGVFKHQDPAMDNLQAKQERLEARFDAKALGPAGAEAGAARVQRGKRGQRGARGPRGARGAAGPKGTFGTITEVEGPSTFLCGFFVGSCAVGSTQATCPPKTTLVGGGYTGAGIVTTVTWSAPVGNSWGIIAVNLDEVSVSNLRAVAQCASA